MKVRLKYCFIFDTNDAWSRKDDFENDLFSYFMGNGLEAQVVQTNKEEEQEDEKMVFLEKTQPDIVETVVDPQKAKPVNPVFKESLKQLTQNGKSVGNTGRK